MSCALLIRVGLGSCGIAAGGEEVFEAFARELAGAGREDVRLVRTGCMGLCHREVLVEVSSGAETAFYEKVRPRDVASIVSEHVVKGRALPQAFSATEDGLPSDPFLLEQKRIVLENCGRIDPCSLADYEAVEGYLAWRSALGTNRLDLVSAIERSGLRGRGGAGFSTGTKWRLAAEAPGPEKYAICNADEGDPGAFMDRSVLEGDPHRLVEGLAIAAYSIGAAAAYVYCRAEYPLALQRLQEAIATAEGAGYLGDDVLGSGFSLEMRIVEGAGAFVCGEETALMASIEGRRGMPRLRPPYPTESGLFGKPTLINNVETLSAVPWIIRHGADEYRGIGAADSPGTKVFAMAGKTASPGLVEVPTGMTLRQIIFDVAGGIAGGRSFKAVQLGGPSGGCLPEEKLDTPIDYAAIAETGAVVGSGGMIIADERTCLVDLARYFMSFTQSESCGKCVPCRVGTKRMLEILERMQSGASGPGELDELEELAHIVKTASLCGLGQNAPNPVTTALRYFRDEFEEHIAARHCRAGVCTHLLRVTIDEATCRGCAICIKHCPVGAISGMPRQPHTIDDEACVKCRACIEHCPFDAITIA